MATEILESPVATATQTGESSWTIDAIHSSVNFSIRHMVFANARGSFTKFDSKLNLNSNDIAKSYVEATIDTSSITTNTADRDTHLKSPDFFDVEKFPEIKFISKNFEKTADGLKVNGFLTIKGITKEVTLEVEGPSPELKDPWGNTKLSLSASTKINRKDFGLTWNATVETGGLMVGEDVTLTIDAEYAKVVA